MLHYRDVIIDEKCLVFTSHSAWNAAPTALGLTHQLSCFFASESLIIHFGKLQEGWLLYYKGLIDSPAEMAVLLEGYSMTKALLGCLLGF